MFTAATAAAASNSGSSGTSPASKKPKSPNHQSDQLRAKRNRFTSNRSFSANELMNEKRRYKQQTMNAMDIWSTYMMTTINDEHEIRVDLERQESSRGCSPTTIMMDEENDERVDNQIQQPCLKSTTLSLSTTSIDTKAAAASLAMFGDPGWGEIARLSHMEDLDDVDQHGHRCGHRRRYDMRQSTPMDAYIARKRFINAVNRVRMESMVCSALTVNRDQRRNTSSSSSTSNDNNGKRSSFPFVRPSVVIESNVEEKTYRSLDETETMIQNGPRFLSRYELNNDNSSTHTSACCSPMEKTNINWSPLLSGRSLASSYTNINDECHQQQMRKRSSSANSKTQFVNNNEKNIDDHSTTNDDESNANVKNSFMALVRIKMFSMKQRNKSSNKSSRQTT